MYTLLKEGNKIVVFIGPSFFVEYSGGKLLVDLTPVSRPYNPYGFTNHWTLNQITYSCYSTFGCFSEIATLIKSVAALKCVPQAFSSRKSKTNLWHLQSLQLMQFVYSHTY